MTRECSEPVQPEMSQCKGGEGRSSLRRPLFAIYAPPTSGKTTLARSLQRKGYRVLDTDEFGKSHADLDHCDVMRILHYPGQVVISNRPRVSLDTEWPFIYDMKFSLTDESVLERLECRDGVEAARVYAARGYKHPTGPDFISLDPISRNLTERDQLYLMAFEDEIIRRINEKIFRIFDRVGEARL